jgi:hypothetical protein
MSDRIDVLKALLAQQTSYHNHKEIVAYAATTLYTSAAVATAVSKDTWEGLSRPRAWVLVSAAIVGWAITSGFVWWQLRMRSDAARRVAAYFNDLVAAATLPTDARVSTTAPLLPKLLTHVVLVASMLFAIIVVLAHC